MHAQTNVQTSSGERREARRERKCGGDRCDWVAAAIGGGVRSVLDIGCGYGWTVARLIGRVPELVGVDLDEEALDSARANYPQVRFVQQTGASLPFDAASFDAVIFSDVIEHVGEENKRPVIDEAWRVLKPGGQLVFTAPYAGLLAWADPMDFKRRFPWVYRLYMRLTSYTPHTPVEVGHKHVSLAEVKALFAGRFAIEDVCHCGFFMPVFAWILSVDDRLRAMPRRWHDGLARFQGWESGVPYGPVLSYNIRIVARKL